MFDAQRKNVWIETNNKTTLFGREYTVVLPKLRDARWIQILSLTTFNTLGQLVYRFHINPLQIVLVVGTCMALDFLLSAIRHRVLLFPISGMISALGISMLLRVEYDPIMYVVFFVAGVLAIGSKHFLTINGRHIFNPSNFAIAALLFFLGDAVAVTPAQWHPSPILIAFIVTCGIWVVKRAKVLDIAVTFVIAELVMLILVDLYLKMHAYPIGLDIRDLLKAPAFLIFTFHMITDPRTAPMNPRARIVYCVGTAVLHWILLGFHQHARGLFFSLLFFCSLAPHLDTFFERHKTFGFPRLLERRTATA